MFNFIRRTRKKNRAQAIVEFALALPILLLVVYGLLETGRLLFIYASTVTAARQAVRYGSATGVSGAGVPYFQDCDGMRAAVQNVGFINRFDDADILISWDRGLDEDGDPIAFDTPPTCATIASYTIQNGHRINVQVSTDWEPIVPLVPLEPFTITSRSVRTILYSVTIAVTAPPESFSGTGSGLISLTVTADPGPYENVGDTILYTYVITNQPGWGELPGPFVVTPTTTNGTITTNCDTVAPLSLADGASFTCYGTYTITQTDMNTGSVVDSTEAKSTTTGSTDTDGTTVILTQRLELNLVKTGSPNASSVVGTVINYQYVVTNTGNVAVTGMFIDDNMIQTRDISCSSVANPLPPGAQGTCTASYTLGQNDINRGTVTNRATANAEFNGIPVESNDATFTVYTPAIYLTVTVTPPSVSQANTPVEYRYYLVNNTGDAISGPFSVSDSRYTVTCPQPASLAAGSSVQCTATYTVTQADIDSGASISNTAQGSAGSGRTAVTSNSVTASLLIVQDVNLTLALTAAPTTLTPSDTEIDFTYTLTNAGKVTLFPATPTDTLTTSITCNGSGALAPTAQRVCTGTRQVSDADRQAGSLTNQATVQYNVGSASGRAASTTSNSVTVVTFEGPRLSMTVTANLNPANVGQIITFTYTLRNTGDATLQQPYNITTDIVDANTSAVLMNDVIISCPLARDTLAPGESTTCTWEYTPGQAGSFKNQSQGTAANADDPLQPPPAVQTETSFTVNP